MTEAALTAARHAAVTWLVDAVLAVRGAVLPVEVASQLFAVLNVNFKWIVLRKRSGGGGEVTAVVYVLSQVRGCGFNAGSVRQPLFLFVCLFVCLDPPRPPSSHHPKLCIDISPDTLLLSPVTLLIAFGTSLPRCLCGIYPHSPAVSPPQQFSHLLSHHHSITHTTSHQPSEHAIPQLQILCLFSPPYRIVTSS